MDNSTIGALIQSLRRDRGLSQTDLLKALAARGLDWHQATLARIESGSRALKATELFVVAEALGVDPNTFRAFDVRRAALLARLDAAQIALRDAQRAKDALVAELVALDAAAG